MKDSIWAVPFSAPEYQLDDEKIDSLRIDHVTRVDPLLEQAFKKIPGESWEKKLDACIRCVCCVNHQINKPKIIRPWLETTKTFKKYGNFKHCYCNCRHMARFICRQVEIDEEGKYYLPPVPF